MIHYAIPNWFKQHLNELNVTVEDYYAKTNNCLGVIKENNRNDLTEDDLLNLVNSNLNIEMIMQILLFSDLPATRKSSRVIENLIDYIQEHSQNWFYMDILMFVQLNLISNDSK